MGLPLFQSGPLPGDSSSLVSSDKVPGLRQKMERTFCSYNSEVLGAYRGKGVEGSEFWPLEVPEAVCLSVCLVTHVACSQDDGG